MQIKRISDYKLENITSEKKHKLRIKLQSFSIKQLKSNTSEASVNTEFQMQFAWLISSQMVRVFQILCRIV